MNKLSELLQTLVTERELLWATLSNPRDRRTPYTKITVKPLLLKGALNYQFAYHERAKVRHSNLAPAAALTELKQLFLGPYRQALLCATAADYQVLLAKDGKAKIITHPPSRVATDLAHDRQKLRLIPENTPGSFLEPLGIMDAQGRVLPSRRAKYKQLNRFLEMVSDIAGELPQVEKLHIVDFGCGKSYLTFALYHYLRQEGIEAEIIGLDLKADVVAHCNSLSAELGWDDNLKFMVGDIKDYQEERPRYTWWSASMPVIRPRTWLWRRP